MRPRNLLIANRGEVAIRVMRAAAELNLRSVAVFSEDDARSLHTRKADEARPLKGRGARAYLDVQQLVAVAQEAGCDALHPGYGFLSESPALAQACADAKIRFIGPRPETLALLGDKVQARALAERCGVPVLRATDGPANADATRDFLRALQADVAEAAIVIKAVSGGGGRGMRLVRHPDEVEAAHARCQSEAQAAFGDGAVYAERLIERARHVEVQVLGDGTGAVCHLGERECTLQRRHQKLVELAPSPTLDPALRQAMCSAAVKMAAEVRYLGLGTFEFLVDDESDDFVFIEANPRLQVEHTVTEEVTGVDLVHAQINVCSGDRLPVLGLTQSDVPAPRGLAMQLRVNMETLAPDGSPRPSLGTLTAFEPPTGPGVRVDTYAYAGYAASPSFDSLLAKVIVHAPGGKLPDLIARAGRALSELRVEGVNTNAGFLQALLEHPDVRESRIYTRFVEEHAAELLKPPAEPRRQRYFTGEDAAPNADDPLAVLQHGAGGSRASTQAPRATPAQAPEGTVAVPAPMQGTVLSYEVQAGAEVRRGQPLLLLAAMKMEHVIEAPVSGIVRNLGAKAGDTVDEGQGLLFIEERQVQGDDAAETEERDLDRIRPDLQEVIDRHAHGLDESRPAAVSKRHGRGHRTARENLTDLIDPDSFVEYGGLVIAAQRRRRDEQELIERTPADGLITGIGRINTQLVGAERAQCAVLSYDYMVMAGTQGLQNHRKKDRIFEVVERLQLPVVFFTEGGGGRPGDTDGMGVSGLDCLAFHYFGRLSGLVPLVGIANGRCFAGNAALAGCCDVLIATESTNLGMGGPAMIEGGGLGVFSPEEIGPIDVQRKSGVVDVAVKDEAEAVAVAKRYLSYFQGPLAQWQCDDQRKLRHIVPENRLRSYDVRQVLDTLADTDSVLELRRDFGKGMITALIRIEGRPLGVIANNPQHLSGAIDSDAADKAARFMQVCDAHDLPILFLCDTPGIMVGPDAEATGLVRHASRLFVTSASLTVPFFTIVLRKGYGLGAQTMAGGSFKAPLFTIAWPTGEFGGMGLEGAVKLGFRKELEAIADPKERREVFDKMVEAAYRHGKGLGAASHFEFDDVIDPLDSRKWIMTALRSAPAPLPRDGKKRPCVDTW
ncbi:MAG: carboxyl transferase domain-containing protein [Myxococcales bacterium]|jgi:acetyl/propionyl-CoA carboxylase alpha subunit/acetyl-CoA carboxylase carboxyltransferase component